MDGLGIKTTTEQFMMNFYQLQTLGAYFIGFLGDQFKTCRQRLRMSWRPFEATLLLYCLKVARQFQRSSHGCKELFDTSEQYHNSLRYLSDTLIQCVVLQTKEIMIMIKTLNRLSRGLETHWGLEVHQLGLYRYLTPSLV